MNKGFKRFLYALLIASMMLNPVAVSATEMESTAVVETAAEETVVEGTTAEETTAEETTEEETAAETEGQVSDEEETEVSVDAAKDTEETESTEEPETEDTEETEEVKNGLIVEDGKTYYYVDGVMQTGIQEVDGKVYYFRANGIAATGYVNVTNSDGSHTFYYFQQDGSAFTGGILTFARNGNNYTMNFGSDGKAKAGYVAANKKSVADANGNITVETFAQTERFYFQKSNGMAFNKGFLQFVNFANGKSYNFYFGTDGKAQTGYKSAATKYYADAQGEITAETGTFRSYFQQGGTAFNKGLLEFQNKGKTYKVYFGSNGLATFKGYVSLSTTYKANATTCAVTAVSGSGKYYIDKDGRAFTGGHLRFVNNANGNTYTFYFGSDGKAYTKGYKATGTQHTADKNGNIKDTSDGKTRYYYFQTDGRAYVSGFLRCKASNGKTYNYFFTTDGSALVNENKVLSKRYSASDAGALSDIGNGKSYGYHFDSVGHGSLLNDWMKVGDTWRYFEDGEVLFSSNDMYKAWSKIKDRSSATRYFVVVDTTACRTFTFVGSAGNWTPKFLWKCGPGRNITPTVTGTFTVGGRGHHFDGKNGEDYTCYYYTQFYGNYLFHSILYHRSSWDVKTATLGRRVSHGCVRLATENAYWFYQNLPTYTKVLIYE